MATTPILGQLGGTMMPATGTGLGGVNQGGNGANALGVVPTTGTAIASPATSAAANPYATATQAVPTAATGAVPGSVDGGVNISGGSTGLVGSAPATAGSQSLSATDPNVYSGSSGSTLAGGLNNVFGAGIGTALTDTLNSMGGQTDQAVQATIANTDLAAQQQMGNIQSQEAAGGVTPNSSTAALAESNFYNQVNTGLQSTISNEELNEEDTLVNTLMSAGSQHGSSPSLLGAVTSGIGDVAGLASGVSSAASALSPASDTSWLDALGAL
jgi:hypothetical protein